MQTRSKLHTKRDVLSKWVLGMSTGFSLEELVGPLERVFSIKRKTIHRYMSDWVTKYTPLHLVLSKIPPHLSLAPISWLNGLDAMAAQIFHTLCICVFVYLCICICIYDPSSPFSCSNFLAQWVGCDGGPDILLLHHYHPTEHDGGNDDHDDKYYDYSGTVYIVAWCHL